jgi:hypothetical protein
MNKAFLFMIMLVSASFTGCVEDEENKPSSLEEAFNNFFDSMANENWGDVCKYMVFTEDEENNTIILPNNAELDECVENEANSRGNDRPLKYTVSNYTEENLDYKAANNSGYIYHVSVDLEICERENEFEPWDCDYMNQLTYEWVKVNGQWLWWSLRYESGPDYPIATFFVSEDNDNVYHVEVITISKQENLLEFSFFLKDGSGSTYVGGNGFGEVAMQFQGGEEMGIDMTYDGDDQQLQDRANNVTNDNGSQFPVHFSDNDRDGNLSSGDQFLVYGPDAGPAQDGWKLDIQFDATGDIIGSAKLL